MKIELDRRLSAGTFRSWRKLSKWFEENGYEISHAALHKYGEKFDRRLDSIRLATERARIVCEQFKDDDVQMHKRVAAPGADAIVRGAERGQNEKPKRVRKKKGDGESVEVEEGCAGESHGACAQRVGAGEGGNGESQMGGARTPGGSDGRGKRSTNRREKGLSPNVADQIRAVLMEI